MSEDYFRNESHIFYSFLSFITKNVINESLLYICRITRTYKKKWSLDDVRSIKNVFFAATPFTFSELLFLHSG